MVARWIFALGLSLTCRDVAQADDPSFVLQTDNPQPYTAAYLGNGAISVVTAPLGTEPARSFLAGAYDHSAGDVPRIASAPAWNEVDINNGFRWLNADLTHSGIEHYRQALDMYNGLLHTTYIWSDRGKNIQIDAEEFVSRDRAQLAATRVTVTPEFAGELTIRFPLRNWPPPRRYQLEKIQKLEGEAAKNQWAIWYPGRLDVTALDVERTSRGLLMSLGATAPGYRNRLGEAIAIDWTGAAEVELHKDTESAEAQLHLNVKRGESYTFTKFAFLVISDASGATQAAKQSAIIARQAGWHALLGASEAAWHALWDSDLLVEGNPDLQRSIHSML
ncbi:MAG: hypothetical protein JOZ36_06380, partial [Acidobacteria bacterium]|nr:hypothetical protein [Acidobacteriota bacterium]